MTTAILAVQGAFAEHVEALSALGEPCILLRQARDLEQGFERLVLPGGESTVQGKLLAEQGMLEPLRQRVAGGMPVLGTCAGLILLADQLEGDDPPPQRRLGTFPARVRRNAYGRQLGSFRCSVPFAGLGSVPATFIRAPRIEELGSGALSLAEHDGATVAARYGNQIVCAFHPELDAHSGVHELFISL